MKTFSKAQYWPRTCFTDFKSVWPDNTGCHWRHQGNDESLTWSDSSKGCNISYPQFKKHHRVLSRVVCESENITDHLHFFQHVFDIVDAADLTKELLGIFFYPQSESGFSPCFPFFRIPPFPFPFKVAIFCGSVVVSDKIIHKHWGTWARGRESHLWLRSLVESNSYPNEYSCLARTLERTSCVPINFMKINRLWLL